MRDFRKIFYALSFIGSAFFFNNIKAQTTYEVGAFTGLGLYKGEFSETPNPINFGANFQVLGRHNIDCYSTVRVNLAQSIMSYSDKNSNSNLSSRRNSSANTSLGEFSAIYEHNFFSYRKEGVRIITTPYLFVGLGAAVFNTSGGSESQKNTFSPIVPFGVGTKTTLNNHWNLNFEFGSRKTFTDYLDNTSDEVNGVQVGFKNTYDWYSFFSVGLTYTIYPLKCPQ